MSDSTRIIGCSHNIFTCDYRTLKLLWGIFIFCCFWPSLWTKAVVFRVPLESLSFNRSRVWQCALLSPGSGCPMSPVTPAGPAIYVSGLQQLPSEGCSEAGSGPVLLGSLLEAPLEAELKEFLVNLNEFVWFYQNWTRWRRWRAFTITIQK